MEQLFKRYFWVTHVIIIMLASILAARGVAHVIDAEVFLDEDRQKKRTRPRASVRPRPVAAKTNTKDANIVTKRNIFCSTCLPEVAVATPEQPSDGSIPLTSLPLTLLATNVSNVERLSSATVQNTQTNRSGAYWMDDEIPSAGKVVHVGQLYVAFRNTSLNRIERVDLLGRGAPPPMARPTTRVNRAGKDGLASAMDKGIRKIDATHYEIDRALVNQVLANPMAVARGARIVPSIQGGKANGFKMYAIRPTSVYHKIGIQNGDTIHAVNGFDISSPDKALEVYTKVKSASSLSLNITRRGKSVTMGYTIK